MKPTILLFAILAVLLTGCQHTAGEQDKFVIEGEQAKVQFERMRQDGGVKRRGAVSLDTKTPFGAYDAAVIATIQKRWYDLLEVSTAAPKSGKVLLDFRMHSDGHITDLRVVEQDVGEIRALYCRKAVSDPAPYAPWPSDMRRMIGKDYRDVRFTFFYW